MPADGDIRHRLSLWLAMAIFAACPLFARAIVDPVSAQIALPSLEFVIPKTVLAREAAETPFVIELKYGKTQPSNSWFEIVMVPAGITLSAGTIENGIWRVPLNKIPGLALKVPSDVQGAGLIYVTLIDNGTLMSAATSFLTIAPQAKPEPASGQAPIPPPPSTPTAAAQPPTTATAAAAVDSKTDSEPRTAPAVVGSVAPPASGASAPPAYSAPMEPNTSPLEKSAVPAVVMSVVPPAAMPSQPPPATVAEAAKPAPPPPFVSPTVPTPAPTTPIDKAAAPDASAKPPLPASAKPAEPQTAIVAAAPQAQRLIALGDRNFADGNIANARQYFAMAAELGSALGAFKLAETSDPYELVKLKIVGLKIDRAEAVRWYRKAVELGMADATTRVHRLQDR